MVVRCFHVSQTTHNCCVLQWQCLASKLGAQYWLQQVSIDITGSEEKKNTLIG